MESLISQIAATAGDDAVQRWGQGLPKGKQLAMWQRYHDSALASLMAFEDLQRAHRIRTLALISEN